MAKGIFIGSPEARPIEEAPYPWQAMGMWWEDYLGNKWDFTSDASGVYLIGDAGVHGLGMPPITHYLSTAPSVPGSVWNGMETSERECIWPLRVYQNINSQLWIDHDSRFWDTLNPARTGKWVVEQPNGTQRYVTLRFRDDGNVGFNIDPALVGWANYMIVMAAENPYWQGKLRRRTFALPSTENWLSNTPAKGVFQITKRSNVSNALIRNDGDVPAFPRWITRGPHTAAQVGISSETIVYPFSVPEGSWTYVDTTPTEQVVYYGETLDDQGDPVWDETVDDRTSEAVISGFGTIPFRENAVLATAITGLGSITVEFPEQHYRAW